MKEWEKRFNRLAKQILQDEASDSGYIFEERNPSSQPKSLIPQVLYKYRPINNRLADLIAGKHYFATAEELNDPFEFKFDLELNPDTDHVRQRLTKHITALLEGDIPVESPIDAELMVHLINLESRLKLNRLKKRSKRNKYLADIVARWMIKIIKENPSRLIEYKKSYLMSEIAKTTRISCYSEIRDSPLMFSHYGDNHKGVCLGFRFYNRDGSGIYGPEKVNYTDSYPVFKEFLKSRDRSDQHIRSTILTKSTPWSYEKEWRCFLVLKNGVENKQEIGVQDLSNICDLSSVIFGCKSSNEDRARVIGLVQDSCKNNVQAFIAQQTPNAYTLSLERIS